MMNLDNYYMHSTGSYEGFNNNKNWVIDILNCQSIHPLFFHNKVCLCDTTKEEIILDGVKLKSAFIHYVEKSPTLCLNRNIKIFTPVLDVTVNYEKQITDLYDEVRHKGNISLEHLEMITFPIWPLDYDLQFDKDLTSNMSVLWKLKNLNIFRDNIEMIKEEFSTIKVKDLYSGVDLTTDFIDERIKQFTKEIIK